MGFLKDYLGNGNLIQEGNAQPVSKYEKIYSASFTNIGSFNSSLNKKEMSPSQIKGYHKNLEEKHAKDQKARQEFNSSINPSRMAKIPCLLSKPHLGSDSLLIYFHANGEDIYRCSSICNQLSSNLNVGRSE